MFFRILYSGDFQTSLSAVTTSLWDAEIYCKYGVCMVIGVCVRQRARDTRREIVEERVGGGGNCCGCFYNSHSQKSCPENECSVPLPSERFLKWFKQNLFFQESRSASVNTAPEVYMHSTSKDLSMSCTWFQFVCVMLFFCIFINWTVLGDVWWDAVFWTDSF